MECESDLRGAVLLLAHGGPGPWKEFVEAIVGPEIDQAGEDIGKPSLGIDAGQFGGFDERGEDGPIFGAVVVTREESILARQSNCPFILPMSGGNWKFITVGIQGDRVKKFVTKG